MVPPDAAGRYLEREFVTSSKVWTGLAVGVLSAAGICAAAPAWAQSEDAIGNHVTIGAGIATVPGYDGSDRSSIEPAFGAQGSVGPVSFSIQESALVTDVVRRRRPLGGKLVAGPVLHATLNRTSSRRTADTQVVALGTLGIAVEGGAQVGYSYNGLLSPYDNATVRVSIVQDLTSVHRSYIITPSVGYGTPLSRKLYVGLNLSADYVGKGYNRAYFGISQAQSQASGLPVFTAKSGFKDVNVAAIALRSLSGDLRKGWAVFALANYARLLDSSARSPVSRRDNQWSGAAGLAYSF